MKKHRTAKRGQGGGEGRSASRPGPAPAPSREASAAALRELDRVRLPLFVELDGLLKDPKCLRGEPAHISCTRKRNQMRISPLEALAIAEAFRRRPGLRRELPEVLERLARELPLLADTTRRQNFHCPLLKGTRCLVHGTAKPIGCLAWNPGREFSDAGWVAFARRDALNDALYGPSWKLQVIPLWLARVLQEPPASGAGPKDRVSGRRGRPEVEAPRRGGPKDGSSPARRRFSPGQ